MKNLVLLCERHHVAHHKGKFSIIALGKQRFRFYRHDGRHLPTHTDPATLIDTPVPIENEHPDVAPDAAGNRWTGERMDHDYAISTIAHTRHTTRKHKQDNTFPASA